MSAVIPVELSKLKVAKNKVPSPQLWLTVSYNNIVTTQARRQSIGCSDQ